GPLVGLSCDEPDGNHEGSRQQCGLHGGASLGGQLDAIGSCPERLTWPTGTLNSFSSVCAPQCGQAIASPLRTSCSNCCSHPSQRNSKMGMGSGPPESVAS